MLVPFNIKNDVSLLIPNSSCCNCGSSHNVTLEDTPLYLVRYMILAGTQITLTFKFPYCSDCRNTAKRTPVGLVKILLLSALLSSVLFLLVVVGLTTNLPGVVRENLIFFTTAVSFVLVSLYYYFKQPTPNQTSYYQPVRLKKVKQKFSGKIVGLALAFTNKEYAAAFKSANDALVNEKVLEVC